MAFKSLKSNVFNIQKINKLIFLSKYVDEWIRTRLIIYKKHVTIQNIKFDFKLFGYHVNNVHCSWYINYFKLISVNLFDTSNWDFIQSDGDLLPFCSSRVFLMKVSFVMASCLSLKDSTKASCRNMYCSWKWFNIKNH